MPVQFWLQRLFSQWAGMLFGTGWPYFFASSYFAQVWS